MMRVLRVQDSNGRGPFRPGVSKKWLGDTSALRLCALPSWMEEFGWDLIERFGLPGEHFGCAVRTKDQIKKWFSIEEQKKLSKLKYKIVSIDIDRVLAESEIQLVFARKKPLSIGAITVPWETA